MQQALAEALAGRTSIVIAHRLSTIRAADLILVVEDGRIVERGTHRQLLARRGRYAELYETQFRRREADGVTRCEIRLSAWKIGLADVVSTVSWAMQVRDRQIDG